MLALSESSPPVTCRSPRRCRCPRAPRRRPVRHCRLSWRRAPLIPGMSVSGTNIPAGTTVTGVKLRVRHDEPVRVGRHSVRFPDLNVPRRRRCCRQSAGAADRSAISAASCANLDTPLPAIDLVNECLELMASVANRRMVRGYDTASHDLAGHLLCEPSPCPPDPCDPPCHPPERIFAALPEYSTPATPVSANANVTPAVWNALKKDFSSCHLPVLPRRSTCRARICGSSAVVVWKRCGTFRRCITEFVLDPSKEPAGFQDHLWRYPVRIDTAIDNPRHHPGRVRVAVRRHPRAGMRATTAAAGPQPPGSKTGRTRIARTRIGRTRIARTRIARIQIARIPTRPGIRIAPNRTGAIPTGRYPSAAAAASPAVWTLYGFPADGDNGRPGPMSSSGSPNSSREPV